MFKLLPESKGVHIAVKVSGFISKSDYEPKIISCHLLQQPYALNLKDFLEHFDFTRTFTLRVNPE